MHAVSRSIITILESNRKFVGDTIRKSSSEWREMELSYPRLAIIHGQTHGSDSGRMLVLDYVAYRRPREKASWKNPGEGYSGDT